MFRFFENLVDPYTRYKETDTPPQRLWAFLWDYAQPFKRLFAWTALSSVLVAGVEVSLIWYVGRVVDLLGQGEPAAVWASHGVELLVAAAFILTIRPYPS